MTYGIGDCFDKTEDVIASQISHLQSHISFTVLGHVQLPDVLQHCRQTSHEQSRCESLFYMRCLIYIAYFYLNSAECGPSHLRQLTLASSSRPTSQDKNKNVVYLVIFVDQPLNTLFLHLPFRFPFLYFLLFDSCFCLIVFLLPSLEVIHRISGVGWVFLPHLFPGGQVWSENSMFEK